MSTRTDAKAQLILLPALASLLDQIRAQKRTVTYLEVADHLGVPGPHRIHKTTRLLETLLAQDVEHGIAPRAALVVSRNGSGRPAKGFFDRADQLGLWDGKNPEEFHKSLLDRLFAGRTCP